MKVNDNHVNINAEAQENDPNSVLNYFRRMTHLRKTNPILVYGKYTLLDKDNPDVYAYTRELDGKKVLVLLNFSSKNAMASTGLGNKKGKVLIDNYGKPSTKGELRPYEAVIYELED